MLSSHVAAFLQAAKKYSCNIGLRAPNEHQRIWVGQAGVYPKPVTCPAKTADNASHPLAGLVVSPVLQDEAFTLKTVWDALKNWKSLLAKRNNI